MSEIFRVKIIDIQSEQLLPLKNGALNNRVRAQTMQKFEILEVATGKAPKKVLTQRAGDDQIVKIVSEVDGEEFDLVIEDFHKSNASLWGGNDAGVLQQYPIAGETQLSQVVLGQGVSATGLVSPFSSTVLAGTGVIGVAAAGGSSAGSAKSSIAAPVIHTVAFDNIINSAEASHSIVITGSKEAGTFVSLTLGALGARILAASADQNWSFTLTAEEVALLGQGDIELTALQTDVNGNVSAVSTLTLTIDTIAENLAPRLARDTGNSNGDGITNVSVLNVSGIEDGATWEYQVDGGDWQPGSAESFHLTEGTHVYSIRQTDIAGNVSAVSTHTLTLDTAAATLELNLDRDSESNGDGITNVAAVNVVGIEDGATWKYQVDGGAWNLGSAESFNLTAGTHVYSVRQTDIAGNVSAVSTHTLTLDTAAATLELNLDSDTGISNGDDITNIAVVNVVGIEDGATWEYQVDGGDWYAGSARSFNLTEGTYPYSVRQTDLAGNVSAVSTRTFTLDTVAPAALDPRLSRDRGSSNSDGITNVATVNVLGLSEGDIWEYQVDGGDWVLSGSGRFDLTQGTHDYSVRRMDMAGNVSAVITRTFTLDTIAENLELSLVSDTGSSNTDGVTNVATVSVGGIEEGATWEYQMDGGAWNPGSAESFHLTDGMHVYSVRQTDVAGNVSAVSTRTIALDTVAVDVGVTLNNMVQLEPLNKTDGDDDRPQIGLVGNNGDYVVTWTGPNSLGSNCIHVQKFNADGTSTGYPLVELLSPIYNNTPTPQISSLSSDGAYVITWHRQDTHGDDSIYVQRFNANGTTNGAATVLEASGVTNNSDQYPEITALGNSGAFVVAWVGNDTGGDGSAFVQQFNTDGSITGRSRVQLEPNSNGEDGQPTIAAVGTLGNYAVTWIGDDGSGSKRVFAQKFNADGTTTGNALTSLDIVLQSGDYSVPRIAAVGADGGFIVASTGRDSRTGGFGIFVQQFDASGSPANHPLVQLRNLNMYDGGAWRPSIASLGATGAYVVAWMGVDNEGDASIFVQQFNTDGTITGRPIVQLEAINLSTGDDWVPKVTAVGNDGSYVVTWCGDDSNGDLSIFVQRFNADGSTTGHDTVQLEAKNNTNGYDADPQITAIGADGAFAVTWLGVDSNGDRSVFVQQFNANGTLRQDKVAIDVVSGQDRWLNAQEESVTLTVRYAELAQGDVIQLREGGVDVGVAHVVTAAEVADGVANLVLLKSSLAGGGSHGEHPLTAVITDLAGNVSSQTPVALTLMVDTTIPPVPTIDTIAGDDTLNGQDMIGVGSANGTPVMVTGTKEAWASIYLTIDDKTYFLSANAGTTWSYALSTDDLTNLTVNGSVTSATIKSNLSLSVRQADAAGNLSEAVTRALRIDTSAPAPNLQLEEDNGSSNTDGVTNFATVNVVGLEVGATWKYQIDAGTWLTGTGTNFELIEGTHVYNVQQTDAAGNTSVTTFSGRTFSLDTVAMVTTAPLAVVQLEAIGKTNGSDYEPQITKLGSGHYAVTWYGQDGAGDYSIFVQQFNVNGTTTGFAPVQLEAIGKTNGADYAPQITVIDSSGGYVVTWCGVDSAGDKSIFVQQFNANGTTTGYAPVQLEAIGVTNNTDEAPQVSAIGAGKYVIAWSGVDDSGSGDRSIFAQQFNADGTMVGNTRVKLESNEVSDWDDFGAQISAVGSNGQYAITWTGVDSGDMSIFVQQFNANGTTAGFPQMKLEPVGAADIWDYFSQITKLGIEGAYAAVWYSLNNSNVTNVYVQRFNSNGTVQGTPIKIENPVASATFTENPQIVSVGSQGAFVVIWEGLGSNMRPLVWVQHFNPDGSKHSLTQLEVFSNQYLPITQPQITSIGTDGAYVAVWCAEDSSPLTAGNMSIFVQQFNADGSTTGHNKVKLDAVGVLTGVDETPQITAIGNAGGYAVTWSGIDASGDRSVFVQQFNSDGTTTKSSVDVQTASGQDSSLGRYETSVTLQVSYTGLSEGQVIEFFESGASLGVSHTVSATDVSAGRANVVVQKDDLGGIGDHWLKVKVTDLAGNVSAESPVAIVLTVDDRPASVISLGAGNGQLINGVQVEGKWYFVWDRDASGDVSLGLTPGSAPDDRTDVGTLARTFLGANAVATDITENNALFTVNGVQLKLPVAGVALPTTSLDFMPGTTWSNGTLGWDTDQNSNVTYDGLLAVWDAYNGTGTGAGDLGQPPNWTEAYYWTANSYADRHGYVGAYGEVGYDANVNFNFVVFQVL